MTSEGATPGISQRRLWRHVLPVRQRRPLAELTDKLDLGSGDTSAKQSAYWVMLSLSAAIATAGVVGDSTATVIGAMIIAPLSVPITGIALGAVAGGGRPLHRAVGIVLASVVVVVGVGVLASLAIPGSFNLLDNSQISGRTSPTIADLVAAIATGFAGAIGIARRDVGDVLPGVAIAISLVPPLAVAGVCLGQGDLALALGAFVLFASNVVSLILAGTFVFVAYGYAREALGERRGPRVPLVATTLILVLLLVPLAANTAAHILITVWTQRISAAANAWASHVPDATIVEVKIASRTAVIDVLAPGELPPTDELLDALRGQVPSGVRVVITASDGRRIDAGAVP